MRLRSAVLLSTAAIAALALSGCSGGAGSDDAEADPLCAAAGSSGDAVESLDVSGTAADGAPDALELSDPLNPEEFEREVVTEGDGDQLAEGDIVTYALAAYDASTGEQVGVNGYEEGEALPQQIAADNALGSVIGCATVGSRIATVYPASTDQSGQQTAAQIQIVDVTGTVPDAAWGEEQEQADGAPVVTVADDGTPSVEIPDDLTVPKTTEVTETKAGDGTTVKEGDSVLLQYVGVKASDGEEFDSSWSRGTPATLQTSGVVEGFSKALVGQKVGSQVVAVIPKTEGYHTAGQEDHELYDEDLVFVVDILGTRHDEALAEAQG